MARPVYTGVPALRRMGATKVHPTQSGQAESGQAESGQAESGQADSRIMFAY
jgi:hypothetical protein